MVAVLLTVRGSDLRRSVGRRLETAVVLVGLVVAATACGGGSAMPGVANLGSSATTSTTVPTVAAAGDKAADYADAVAYAGCMRSHGVPDMPDPDSNGNFLVKGGQVNGVKGVVTNSAAAYQKADNACSHLLPNGGQMTPAEQQQAIAQALKFVQCMRTHGVPNMPDPKTSNGGIALGGRGLDPRSPSFQAAQKACRSLSPFPSP